MIDAARGVIDRGEEIEVVNDALDGVNCCLFIPALNGTVGHLGQWLVAVIDSATFVTIFGRRSDRGSYVSLLKHGHLGIEPSPTGKDRI